MNSEEVIFLQLYCEITSFTVTVTEPSPYSRFSLPIASSITHNSKLLVFTHSNLTNVTEYVTYVARQ
jgi:hypothetical protein